MAYATEEAADELLKALGKRLKSKTSATFDEAPLPPKEHAAPRVIGAASNPAATTTPVLDRRLPLGATSNVEQRSTLQEQPISNSSLTRPRILSQGTPPTSSAPMSARPKTLTEIQRKALPRSTVLVGSSPSLARSPFPPSRDKQQLPYAQSALSPASPGAVSNLAKDPTHQNRTHVCSGGLVTLRAHHRGGYLSCNESKSAVVTSLPLKARCTFRISLISRRQSVNQSPETMLSLCNGDVVRFLFEGADGRASHSLHGQEFAPSPESSDLAHRLKRGNDDFDDIEESTYPDAWVLRRVSTTESGKSSPWITSSDRIVLSRRSDGARLSAPVLPDSIVDLGPPDSNSPAEASAHHVWTIVNASHLDSFSQADWFPDAIPDVLREERRTSPDVDGLSSAMSEENLVQEVLATLLGIPGGKIVLGASNSVEYARADMTATHPSNIAAKEFISQRFFPIMNDLFYLRACILKRSYPEAGRISQGLASGLSTIVSDFELLAMGERTHYDSQRDTLQSVWNRVQGPSRLVGQWARFLRSAEAEHGISLISHLSSSSSTDFTPALTDTDVVVRATMEPLSRMLRVFLATGDAEDPCGEFFVRVNRRVDMRVHTTAPSKAVASAEYYWNHRFKLFSAGNANDFLSPALTNLALRAGRDVDARLVLPSTRAEAPKRFEDDEEGEVPERNFAFDTGLSLTDSESNAEWIRSAHSDASRAFMDYVRREGEVMEWLRLTRRYFLLDGDLFNRLDEVVGEELMKPVDRISKPRLGNLLYACLRGNRNEAQDLESMFTKRLACSLASETLDEFLHLHLDPAAKSAQTVAARATATNSALLGIDAFGLSLQEDVPWPASLVLSRRIMKKYEVLFRHLFKTRRIERRVGEAWSALRQNSGVSTTRSLHLAVQRMLHFCSSLNDYLYRQVVDLRWTEMLAKIEAATSMDEVLSIHEAFLDTCSAECLLTDGQLVLLVARAMDACRAFADKIVRSVEDGDVSPAVAHEETNLFLEFDVEVRAFLNRLQSQVERHEHLSSLVLRLDLSGFYFEQP